MANQEHIDRLKSGRAEWNRWREEQPGGENAALPDLSRADLSGLDLHGMNFFRASLAHTDLSGANLTGADFMQADLEGAQFCGELRQTRFYGADLTDAHFWFLSILDRVNFSEATMRRTYLNNVVAARSFFVGSKLIDAQMRTADLTGADFSFADLSGADLSGANLTRATLVETTLNDAHIDGCNVFGASVWKTQLSGATQLGLVVTPVDQPRLTVDSLALAQFIYLLLENAAIRDVIDTVTAKVVLILGSFSTQPKEVLNALREALRKENFTPVIFDFSTPRSKDMTGTIETLARMARFIVADLTNPSSVPHELASTVPLLRTTPVVLLRLAGSQGYTMVDDFSASYSWVLPVREYQDAATLMANLDAFVIQPAEARLKVLRPGDSEHSVRTKPPSDTRGM